MQFVLSIILLFISASMVNAQETAPGEVCTVAETNYIRQVGGPETTGVVHLMRCNGTNWQQYMTFLVNGDVGIGTANPSSKLHINALDIGPSLILQRDRSASGMTGNSQLKLISSTGGNVSDGLSIGGIDFESNDLGTTAVTAQIKAIASANHVDGVVRNTDIALFTTLGTSLSEKFRIKGNGNVGIQNSSPQATLDVAGDIYYSGVLRDISDRNAKTSIKPISNSLHRIVKLDGVSFVMKGDEKKRLELGFIAQDVQSVFPNLVDKTSDGRMGLSYTGLIAPMVEAIKELDSLNAEQDQKISSLEKENAKLRQSIQQLLKRMDVIEGKRRPPLKAYNH